MPTRKIADLPQACNSPDHDPPMYMYYPNGIYEHVCSGCGRKFQFTVSQPTLNHADHMAGTSPASWKYRKTT
jgi:hypothetical protein